MESEKYFSQFTDFESSIDALIADPTQGHIFMGKGVSNDIGKVMSLRNNKFAKVYVDIGKQPV